jgi:Family of unknown function (DUF6452)
MKFRILFFIFIILFAGCVDVETCDEDSESELVARLKTVKDGLTSDSTVTALSLYGIREGMPDSLIYNLRSVPGFIVPLNPHLPYSKFVLEINEQTDTLTIFHQQELYMISYTCGFAYLFTLEHLDHGTGIIVKDSILEKMVDAEYETDEVHIWLYL